MNLVRSLQRKLFQALTGLVDDPTPYATQLKATQDARHGDYQANCAMSLAKVLGKTPREVAEIIKDRLGDNDEMVESAEIAGPGFINLRLRQDWLAEQIQRMACAEHLGVGRPDAPRKIVIDFSSPNVAKPMHVGHLRSTIIGDCLARLFRFLGHSVITDNHLGDWGTQFGILLYGYKNHRDEQALQADPVREMTRIYVHVRTLMKLGEDEEAEGAVSPVAEAARRETAKLHAGDEENGALWRKFMPWCLEEIDRIYRRLDIHFDQTLGESSYNPVLPEVVRSLQERGIAQDSEGAVAIFFHDDETPALIRKKDGAFTYTTTDLATIRHRIEEWQADAILYVVDARQALHFKNLFDAARRWGYDKTTLEHITFGSVLGADRKPIKTREGGAIELGELLDEASRRGEQVYDKIREERLARGEDLPELVAEERSKIAEVVGLGAVKYADLSQNRTTDYVFNWDKMLATDGNTATYMQYAYARVRSIFRKGEESTERFRATPPLPTLDQPHERGLALQLLRFEDTLTLAAQEYKPNLITGYLWDLAKSYSGFFENCPVLKAQSDELRQSRLLLCDLTARVLVQSLALLGIGTVERM